LALACVVAGVLCLAATGIALTVLCLDADRPGAAPPAPAASGPLPAKLPPAPAPTKGIAAPAPKAANQAPAKTEPTAPKPFAARVRRSDIGGPADFPKSAAKPTQPPTPGDLEGVAVKPANAPDRPPDPRAARLLEELQSLDRDKRLAAMRAVGNLGTPGKDAVLILLHKLVHYPKDEADRAAWALAQIGWPAVPALVQALDEQSPGVRARALWALAVIGPDARAAVGPIGACLADEDPMLRVLAAWALGAIGPNAQPATPLLAQALRDSQADVRAWAAWALHEIGPETLDELLTVLQGGNWLFRLSAVQALGDFAERKEALEALVSALQDAVPMVRAAAAGTLLRLGPRAEAALPDLLLSLRDGDLALQTQAYAAILAIGNPPTVQLREDLAALNSADGSGWATAAPTPSQRKAEIKRLLAALDDPNPTRRLAAVLALAQLGPEAKAAGPALWNTLGREGNRCVLAALLVGLPALEPNLKMPAKTPEMFLAEIRKKLQGATTIDADELVRFYLLSATLSRPGLLDGRREPNLPEAVKAARDWAAQAVESLPAESAVMEALVRGVNVTAEFHLGFTEPFSCLCLKLRALARGAKDVQTLSYAQNHLGDGVPAGSPLEPSLRLAALEVLNNPAWLDAMIAVRQRVLLELATLKAQDDRRSQLVAMKQLQALQHMMAWAENLLSAFNQPQPTLVDQIWIQPVTVYPWNLASDSAASTPGSNVRSFVDAHGLRYKSGTQPNQPAAFNPSWQLFEAKVSYTGAVSGKIIVVVPGLEPTGPVRKNDANADGDNQGGGMTMKNSPTQRTLLPAVQPGTLTIPSAPRTPGTITTPAQSGAVPKVDLPTLIMQTEQELALLRQLKTQTTLNTTRDQLLKLAKENEPAFLAKLQDPDPVVRMLVAIIVGQKALPVQRELIKLLGDPVLDVRQAAHLALVRLARGTDLGPAVTDSPAKIKLAIERWSTWLDSQEPWAPTVAVPTRPNPNVNPVVVEKSRTTPRRQQ
jgi:HEAT repeat protein